MKTSQLREMMTIDAKLDHSRLDEESLNTPNLHGKYYGLMMDENKILRSLEMELARMKKFKFEYYTGKSEDKVYQENPLPLRITKPEFETYYIDADSDIQKLQEKIFIQKEKVTMLQEFIKHNINGRGYFIKEAIAFYRFKNGLN